MNHKDLAAIGKWLAYGNIGVSSRTMLAIALNPSLHYDRMCMDAPHDPSDFLRCCNLIEAVPSIRDDFERIGQIVPQFAGILREFDALCEIVERDRNSSGSQELYDRIQTLRKESAA